MHQRRPLDLARGPRRSRESECPYDPEHTHRSLTRPHCLADGEPNLGELSKCRRRVLGAESQRFRGQRRQNRPRDLCRR